jgi:hypothetical protein
VSRGVGAEEVGDGVVRVPKTDGTLVSSENSVNSLTDISMANLGRSGRLGPKRTRIYALFTSPLDPSNNKINAWHTTGNTTSVATAYHYC